MVRRSHGAHAPVCTAKRALETRILQTALALDVPSEALAVEFVAAQSNPNRGGHAVFCLPERADSQARLHRHARAFPTHESVGILRALKTKGT